jgi:AcrR family transcriptional regulator
MESSVEDALERMVLLRCIAYCSVPMENWSERQIDDLQTRIAEKNTGNKITGFLLMQDGRFIQVLEGVDLTVSNVFEKITADPRHRSMVKLLDRPIDRRAFSAWSIGLPDAGNRAHQNQQCPAENLGRADSYLAKPQLDTQPLLGLMGTSVERMLRGLLRVKPVQTRAIETVDRLISAAETIIIRQGLDKVTVEAVAAEATLTHQATYRYFKNTGDIFRIVMKKRQSIGFKRIIDALEVENFDSDADIAHFVASFSFRSYLQDGIVPRKTKLYLIRNYHDIAYDEIWKLAESIYNTMARCNILRLDIGVTEIAAGLAAMAGALKLMMIRDDAPLDQSQTHPILVRLFLSALDSASKP